MPDIRLREAYLPAIPSQPGGMAGERAHDEARERAIMREYGTAHPKWGSCGCGSAVLWETALCGGCAITQKPHAD